MARIKGAMATRKRRKKVLKAAKGYYGGKHRLFKTAKQAVMKSGQERNGIEYHFFTADEFRKMIAEDKFVEYEEVYAGSFYGTLKSEVQRIWDKGHVIIFDVDVKGGVNLKKYFGDKALSVFIQAPSVEELRKRLVARGTDSAEAIAKRVAKASEEMTYADKFDYILVNDDLQKAYAEAEKVVDDFLQ